MVTVFPVLWSFFWKQIQKKIKTNHLKHTCLFYQYCHYIKLLLKTLNLFYLSQLTLLLSVLFPARLSSGLQLFWLWSFLNIIKSTFWRSFYSVLSVGVTCIMAVLSHTAFILSEQSFAIKSPHHPGSGRSLRNLKWFPEASCKYTQSQLQWLAQSNEKKKTGIFLFSPENGIFILTFCCLVPWLNKKSLQNASRTIRAALVLVHIPFQL